MKPSDRDGFTLVEVMIALALFALIAVAGFSLLDGVLRAEEATDERLERMSRIQRAMLVVSTDLDQISGGLEGGGSALILTKTDLGETPISVRYDLTDQALTRTVSGPQGERTQVLIDGVSAVRWTFHRRRGDWLDIWPQAVAPIVPLADGLGLVGGRAPTIDPDAGVTAVALDLTLTGFDGRQDATLRRVASIPLQEAPRQSLPVQGGLP